MTQSELRDFGVLLTLVRGLTDRAEEDRRAAEIHREHVNAKLNEFSHLAMRIAQIEPSVAELKRRNDLQVGAFAALATIGGALALFAQNIWAFISRG